MLGLQAIIYQIPSLPHNEQLINHLLRDEMFSGLYELTMKDKHYRRLKALERWLDLMVPRDCHDLFFSLICIICISSHFMSHVQSEKLLFSYRICFTLIFAHGTNNCFFFTPNHKKCGTMALLRHLDTNFHAMTGLVAQVCNPSTLGNRTAESSNLARAT